MRSLPSLGAASLCFALLVGGCTSGSGNKSAADLTADLASSLQDANTRLSDDSATCWAGVIVEVVGADTLQSVKLSADDPSDELQNGMAEAATKARSECDLTSLDG